MHEIFKNSTLLIVIWRIFNENYKFGVRHLLNFFIISNINIILLRFFKILKTQSYNYNNF